MRTPRFGLLNPVFVSSLLTLFLVPITLAGNDDDTRDVRLDIVQGDVRLSRGNHNRLDLKQPWEEALPNENISQGFALATGNGRASIDFEDGSTVYLAENSLLVFNEISATEGETHSSLVLITGSASFSFKPPIGGNYVIITPLDRILISSPQSFYTRIGAYLDATAITPLARAGDVMERTGAPDFRIPKGGTILMAHGEILSMPGEVVGDHRQDTRAAVAKCTESLRKNAPLILDGTFLESLCSRYADPSDNAVLSAAESIIPAISDTSDVRRDSQSVDAEWDLWVGERQNQKKSLLAAAMNASGLDVPIPGLTELFQHGAFFKCPPYGTCWEPAETPLSQSPSDSQGRSQNPPGPSSPSQNSTFRPQTIVIPLFRQALCGLDSPATIARVAHSQAELEELRHLKELAERYNTIQSLHFLESCSQHTYIPHNGHYARVLTPNRPPVCHKRKCKHPPFPHGTVVRIGGRIGIVPRHPADIRGKPPINLKNGILLPPAHPGEPFQRITLDPSVKIRVLDKLPSSFSSEFRARAPAVAAPEIRAHLVTKDLLDTAAYPSARPYKTEIVYDYRSQRFLLPGDSVHGQSFGAAQITGSKISALMSGHSDRLASSFARSNGSYSSGSGGGPSGGSHVSGNYSAHFGGSNSSSSGSSHSSSDSSSSSSSSGGSHYSGGGSTSGSSGSSASSSSSTGSSSSGGRPH